MVQVDDDGRGPAPGHTAGAGITGMRERVHALGGDLEVGATGGRGFHVRARFPIGGHR